MERRSRSASEVCRSDVAWGRSSQARPGSHTRAPQSYAVTRRKRLATFHNHERVAGALAVYRASRNPPAAVLDDAYDAESNGYRGQHTQEQLRK